MKQEFCKTCKKEIGFFQWILTADHGYGLCKDCARKSKIEEKKQRKEFKEFMEPY